jgi:2-isopropylmalate synthase
MEAGFAASSPGDFEAVSRIAAEVRGPVIASLARAHPDDIDKAADALKAAERFRIHVFMSTSAIHMEKMLRMTPDEVLKASIEGVKRAKRYTDDVEFSPQDATRTDFDFLIDVCKAAVAAGATTINIPDTVGYATPTDFVELMKRAFREVKGDRDDVIVSVHCHNDLGLAVANSLSAIHAGARQIEGAINGIGERAGNTSIEEIIMAVKTRQDVFGVEIGADTRRLFDGPRAGVPPHRLPGAVQQGGGGPQRLRPRVGHPPARRAARPHHLRDHGRGVGRPAGRPDHPRQALRSGRLRRRPHQARHHPRRGRLRRAFDKFKQLADRKVQIGEEELRAIVDEEAAAPVGDGRMLGLHVTGGNDVTPSATVTLDRSTARSGPSRGQATAWCTPRSPPSSRASASTPGWSTIGWSR